MPHSYSNLLTHIVYSTKNRRPLIDSDLSVLRRDRATTRRNVIHGEVEDHVHLLAHLPPTIAVAEAIGKIKGSSTHWIHESFTDRSEFSWQRGYGAFSVSKSNVARVVRYIEQRKAHHKKQSFQEEFVELLRRHGISIDEKYLWT